MGLMKMMINGKNTNRKISSKLKKQNSKTLKKCVFVGQISAVIMMAGIAIFQYNRDKNRQQNLIMDNNQHRYLAGSASCDEEVGGGEMVWALLLTLYMFLGLAIVCDEYFQISLELISEKLKLSPDVAGATFLAAGSSAPELFTSLSDAFGDQNSVGMGTIVGSAMFNILVIVAASAAVAGQGGTHLDIDPRPVIRDVSFYTSSILLLALFFSDKKIEIWESIIMVVGYGSYTLFMKFNARVFEQCDKIMGKGTVKPDPDIEKQEEIISTKLQLAELELGPTKGGDDKGGEDNDDDDELDAPFMEALKKKLEAPEADSSALDKILYYLSIPWIVIFHFTVPDAGNKQTEHLYSGTFFMSIIWIAVMCAIMVNMATRAACFFKVSPIVLGVTVLAVGTSVPDAIGSVLAAKSGEADMAIANAIGSNVFDILLGLGFPWTLVIIFKGENVPVDADGITGAIIILFATVFLFLGVLIVRKWKMDGKVGAVLLALYFIYIIYTIATA